MPVVLVVEDETQVRILAEAVLEDAGYETVSAGTLAEAQAILQSEQKIDFVFTDITLGDDAGAGLEVGRVTAHSRPGVPVLYATGRGVTDGMIKLFVEPHGFLAKPYTPVQILYAVAELLGRNKDARA
jgi:DNA-binding NtrC family response regulator